MHSNYSGDAQHGVSNDTEDDENELHDELEHAALDDDFDDSPACPCRELHATHVACLARREIPDVRTDEGGRYHGRAKWRGDEGET